MIHFKEIEIIGFGSIINKIIFNLDQSGLNIFRGPVGAGKTSIPSTLYWCLYGISLKKGSSVQTWDELQPNDFKGTMVRTLFYKNNDKYEIIRCISYKGNVFKKKKGGSGIHIIKNDDYVEIKGKRDIQAEIQKIIGYSSDLFTNSIIYGQRLKRIIEESGPSKKKIFDEAFETVFIDKAKSKAQAEDKQLSQLLEIENSKLDGIKSGLSELKSTYKDLLKFEKSFKDIKQGNLKKFKTSIPKIKSKIKDIEDKIIAINILNYKELKNRLAKRKSKLEKLTGKLDKKQKLEQKRDKTLKNLNQIQEEIKTVTNNTCFTCGSTLTTNQQSKLIKKILKQRDENREDYTKIKDKLADTKYWPTDNDIRLLTKELEELEKQYNSISYDKERKEELEETKDNLLDELNTIDKDYKKVKKEKLEIKSHKYEKKIIEAKENKRIIKDEIQRIEKERELYKWLINDPLSNSGIKAYIFNSLLSKVNHILEDYSKILGFRIEFGIDIQSANKDFYQMIYRDDNLFNKGEPLIIPYQDLSGGQKQLVDTAVALAIHGVISSVRPTNILFLDEPFEGLDNDTIELVSDIISYKSQNQSLFLITHHDSFNPTNANTFYFNLGKDGATSIS